MRTIILLLITALALSATAEERKLVWPTSAFQTVEHTPGKWRYIGRILPILQELRIKAGEFDAMNTDKDTLYNLAHVERRWNEITKAIEAVCAKPENKKKCDQLAQERIDAYQWNKDNPVDYVTGEPVTEPIPVR